MANPFYTGEHEAFREVMRRFVAREVEPYAHQWDEEGEFPRALYAKASEIGLLGLGFPEEYGGIAADQFMKIVASQELARAGAGGRLREPDEPHHRLAADRPRRPPRGQGAGAAGGACG
jgi:acyl-CoA dehydrogenase